MNMRWVLYQDIITDMIICKIVLEKLIYLTKQRPANISIDLFGGFEIYDIIIHINNKLI